MRKVFGAIIILLFMSACSNAELTKSTIEDGEQVANIIFQSFMNKEIYNDHDDKIVTSFFEKHSYPEDGNFENEKEEFIYQIALLEILKTNYIRAYNSGDVNKMDKKSQSFIIALSDLKENYDIKINQ